MGRKNKKSIEDLKNDLMGQKSMLRLEPAPIITHDLDKGKGLVFDFYSRGVVHKGHEKSND